MAAKQNGSSAVISIKAKKTIALPPLTLGFASLVTPDTYEPDKPLFKLNGHVTPEAIAAVVETIKEKVYTEAMLEKAFTEAADKGMKLKGPIDPAEWLGDKLKEPKENARIQLPHLTLSVPANYKDKSGEVQTREIACWDGNKRKLNLKRLKLGMGSIIAPVVYPNLFASKLMGSVLQPSLKLVGLYVLKLERFGGGAAPADTDEDAIKEVLGDAFVYEDLSAYMGAGADEDGEDQSADHPEDQSPEDIAKGMF